MHSPPKSLRSPPSMTNPLQLDVAPRGEVWNLLARQLFLQSKWCIFAHCRAKHGPSVPCFASRCSMVKRDPELTCGSPELGTWKWTVSEWLKTFRSSLLPWILRNGKFQQPTNAEEYLLIWDDHDNMNDTKIIQDKADKSIVYRATASLIKCSFEMN